MTRRLPTLTLILSLQTGCPDTWGKEGAVDLAVRKSIREERERRVREKRCDMPKEEWLALCYNGEGHQTSWRCPEECRP